MKLYEAHALAHWLLIVSAARLFFPAAQDFLAIATVAVPALPATPLAVYFAARDLRHHEAEAQFAAWFRVPEGASFEFRDGHWFVDENATPAEPEVDRRNAVA